MRYFTLFFFHFRLWWIVT